MKVTIKLFLIINLNFLIFFVKNAEAYCVQMGGLACPPYTNPTCEVCVWTCFAAGTKVNTLEGKVDIESVKVGDKVVSQDESGKKSMSTVAGLDQPVREHMCRLDFDNGLTLKMTEEHPVMTQDGWKALDPNKTKNENPNLKVKKLQTGDKIVRDDGSFSELNNVSCWSEITPAYNLILDGSVNTYFANGFLAHNKGGAGDPTCVPNCPADYCGDDGCGNKCTSPNDPTAPSNMVVTQTNGEGTSATISWTPGNWGAVQLVRFGEDSVEVSNGCPGNLGAPCLVASSFPTYTQPADPSSAINMYYFDKDATVNRCVSTTSTYSSISTCETNLATYVTTPPFPNGTAPRSTGICYLSLSDCNIYNGTSYLVNNLEAGTEYTSRLVNYKGSTCYSEVIGSFTSTCTSTAPDVPILNSPANATQVMVGASQTLDWGDISNWGLACTNASNRYEVCVSSNSGSTCDLASYVSTGLTSQYNFVPAVANSSILWSVRSNNGSLSSQSGWRNVCAEGYNASDTNYLSNWSSCDATTHKRTRSCTENCGTDNCSGVPLVEDCTGDIRGTIFDATDLSSCPSFDPSTGYLIGVDTSLSTNKTFGLVDQNNTAPHPWSLLNSATTDSNGNYSVRVYAPATYTYDFSSWSDMFVVSSGPKLTCTSASAVVPTSTVGCTTQPCSNLNNISFGFNRYWGGWWQVVGASIHGEEGVKSSIPSSLSTEQSLILPDTTTTSRRGVVSYGQVVPAMLGLNTSAKVSDNLWQAQSHYDGVIYDYAYFNQQFKKYATTLWDGASSISYDPNGKDYQIFKVTGPVANFSYNPTGTEKVIFLINGDVTINSNLTVPDGSFMTIIANGDITFGTAVTRADGWFLGKNINVRCVDSNSDLECDRTDVQFNGNGSFVGWKGINLTRDQGGATNITQPAELFTYRLDLYNNAPEPMKIITKRYKPYVP